MAVTTEPPWVNFASGTAARNGTTSHTVSFGFTSTTGNELLVAVYAGVTNAVTGWTERLQPVQDGELSVFTKTSAGESSITVTHNGSNMPMGWVAYELPSGSTWTNGTSGIPTSDTFPALGSLPGTEQVVWACLGRIAASTATAGSAVWPSPYVEDVDNFTAFATNEGFLFTVGRQINFTGTTVTPTITPTYTGTWVSTDRELAVFAMNVAALPAGDTTPPSVPTGLATTAVGATTADLSWTASTDNVGVTQYEVIVIGP